MSMPRTSDHIFKNLISLKVSKLKMDVFMLYYNTKPRLACLLGCLNVFLLLAILVLVIFFHSGDSVCQEVGNLGEHLLSLYTR